MMIVILCFICSVIQSSVPFPGIDISAPDIKISTEQDGHIMCGYIKPLRADRAQSFMGLGISCFVHNYFLHTIDGRAFYGNVLVLDKDCQQYAIANVHPDIVDWLVNEKVWFEDAFVPWKIFKDAYSFVDCLSFAHNEFIHFGSQSDREKFLFRASKAMAIVDAYFFWPKFFGKIEGTMEQECQKISDKVNLYAGLQKRDLTLTCMLQEQGVCVQSVERIEDTITFICQAVLPTSFFERLYNCCNAIEEQFADSFMVFALERSQRFGKVDQPLSLSYPLSQWYEKKKDMRTVSIKHAIALAIAKDIIALGPYQGHFKAYTANEELTADCPQKKPLFGLRLGSFRMRKPSAADAPNGSTLVRQASLRLDSSTAKVMLERRLSQREKTSHSGTRSLLRKVPSLSEFSQKMKRETEANDRTTGMCSMPSMIAPTHQVEGDAEQSSGTIEINDEVDSVLRSVVSGSVQRSGRAKGRPQSMYNMPSMTADRVSQSVISGSVQRSGSAKGRPQSMYSMLSMTAHTPPLSAMLSNIPEHSSVDEGAESFYSVPKSVMSACPVRPLSANSRSDSQWSMLQTTTSRRQRRETPGRAFANKSKIDPADIYSVPRSVIYDNPAQSEYASSNDEDIDMPFVAHDSFGKMVSLPRGFARSQTTL